MRARRLMAGHTTFNREHGGSNPFGRIQIAKVCKSSFPKERVVNSARSISVREIISYVAWVCQEENCAKLHKKLIPILCKIFVDKTGLSCYNVYIRKR